MRILFINAIDPYSEVQSRWPNLGLGYLASALRPYFKIDFKIVSRNIPQEIKSFRPDIVGITAVSQNYGYAKQYAAVAKQAGLPVIIGGMHISALPYSMTRDMDIAVIGEGERTIVEVVERLWSPNGIKDLSSVKGIAFRINDRIFMTGPRPLIDPLDQISRPARDLMKIRTQSSLFSSRGCPYRCTFCASSRYWKAVRFFSASYVCYELMEMIFMGVKRVNFYDDLMIADLPRLIELHNNIVNHRELRRLRFWLNARANTVTEETAHLMADMGVVSVGMGLESGNARTLKYLKGGSVSVEDNYNAIRLLHENGIAATASFVIGSPDETEEEIMDTYHFIENSGLDFVDVFPLVPYPGTPVWDEARARGFVSDIDMDWSRLGIYHNKKKDPIIMSRHLTRADMDRIYAKFQRLRLKIAAKRAWFHPFFKEMIKAGSKKLFNSMRKQIADRPL
jgi:radical SAM superfamily enzyme YgiQ (UPF0313 family)